MLQEFNSAMESGFSSYTTFFLPDQELRDELKAFLSELVPKAFARFAEKYPSSLFSPKTAAKVARYNPEVLTQMFASFFEGYLDFPSLSLSLYLAHRFFSRPFPFLFCHY